MKILHSMFAKIFITFYELKKRKNITHPMLNTKYAEGNKIALKYS